MIEMLKSPCLTVGRKTRATIQPQAELFLRLHCFEDSQDPCLMLPRRYKITPLAVGECSSTQGFCYLRRLIGRIIIKYVDLGFRNDFSKIAYYFANSKLFIITRNHTHYRNIHLYAPSGFLYHFLLCLAGQKYNIEKRFFFIHDPIVLSLPFLVCRMSHPYQTQSLLSIE